jgi:formate C-acetyltransferase
MFSLTSALEMALFQGKHRHTEEEQFGPVTPSPSEISSFDDFMAAFENQTTFMIEQSAELNNMLGKTHLKVNPLPFLSALTQGTLNSGKDVLEGGATYNSSGVAIIGLSEVVDSLCAIKEFGFGNKGYTFPDLVTAINADWVGHENTRKILTPEQFGTESKRYVVQRVIILIVSERTTEGRYQVPYWTMTTPCRMKLTGALPSSRKRRVLQWHPPVSGRRKVPLP